jgi:glyoxylase-like metal-dependent hydrolase (beta-lactamase superfamily II)
LFAKRITERVYALDTRPFDQPNIVSVYLIKGPKPTLVDCGYASTYANVMAGLSEAGVAPSEVRYIIPTHVHLDHAGAAGLLLSEMPNAEMIAHEKGVPHLIDPTRLVESATRIFGKTIMEMYGDPVPVPAGRITPVGKEMYLDLGDGLGVTLIHSPGHAPHQVSVFLEGRKFLLTADAVGTVYPEAKVLVPTTPPPSFDPEALVRSVGSLEQTDPGKLLVPHFGPRDDVAEVFGKTKEKVQRWVKEVREMKGRKLGLEEISEAMSAEVKREAGITEIPIYVQISIRNSVMGIMHYLDKNP